MNEIAQQEFIPAEPHDPGPQPLAGEFQQPEAVVEPEAEAPPQADDKAEKPAKEEAGEKPKERRKIEDIVKDAAKKSAEEAAKKAEDKPEGEEKPKAQRREDGKSSKADAEVPEGEEAPQPKRESAFRDPPKRFDEAAKKDWEHVPESVRGSINRMQREYENGIEKYRRDAEEYGTLREYRELAKAQNTDIKSALDNYVSLDRLLTQNPIAGLEKIVSNLGLKDQQGQPVTLRSIAAAISGQTPDQVSRQYDIQMQSLRQELEQSRQQITQMTQYVEQQKQQVKLRETQSEIDAFAAEHPRFEELQEYIAETLQKYPASSNIPVRERLADAYAVAAARYPAPDAAHTGTTSALAQTQTQRNRAKSITGSPSAGAQVSTSQTRRAKRSLDDVVANAIRRASS